MLVLFFDLKALELDASDVPGIFWQASEPGGAERLTRRIETQYMELRDAFQEKGLRHKLETLVAQVVALGAVRGLGWGLMLERKRIPDDAITRRIIQYKKVRDLLLREGATVKDICAALDDKKLPLLWKDLRDKSTYWISHHKEKKVMMAIGRARKTAKQNAEDIEYLKAAVTAAREAAEQKKKAVKTAKQPNLFSKGEE